MIKFNNWQHYDADLTLWLKWNLFFNSWTSFKGVILDADTYYFNLTQANQESNSQPNIPVWKLEYSMSEVYSMNNFTIEGFAKLVDQLKNNDSYLQTYYKFYYRLSDAMPGPQCNNDCKNSLINDIITANPYKLQNNLSIKIVPKIMFLFIVIICTFIYKNIYLYWNRVRFFILF